MKPVFPEKLQKGDVVAVVAPSRSLAIVPQEAQNIANERFANELGLQLVFGDHVNVKDAFLSASVAQRVADLHAAFANPKVKAIFTVLGGLNANQLLDQLDWELIAANPKILCGYSDITVLQNAIFAKTGLVTYSGPHYSTFGQAQLFPYTVESLRACLYEDQGYSVLPSERYNDDRWWEDQQGRTSRPNEGWWILQEGEASGRLLGGNLGTLTLLHGTPYMPDLSASVLFLEDDEVEDPPMFDRLLQSLTHQPGFKGVRGVVIGRFQRGTVMTRRLLEQIVASKQALRGLPVIANADFGHTNPFITYPIGGSVEIEASDNSRITITKH